MKKLLFAFLSFAFLLFTFDFATAQIPSYVPTNGLVAWYPFNGNVNDESGNGNHGTNYNANLISDRFGVANKALNFNGTTSYIEVRDTASLRLTEASFSFWIAYTSTNKMVIFAKQNFFTGGNGNYGAEINDYANLLVGMRPIGSYGSSCNSNAILT